VAALGGMVVALVFGGLIDAGLNSLPDGRATAAVVMAASVGLAVAIGLVIVRGARRQTTRDREEHGWRRTGPAPMRQAPIVEEERFVAAEEAMAELSCGRITLNVLTVNGLDPCWSASGERGFTRESVDAEAAYRRTASPSRLAFRTLGRALARGA
jgi:hypothetical protein